MSSGQRQKPASRILGRRIGVPAFTILELLVVLAIIGLLIGVLLPVLGSVRSSGEAAREVSAARQLMLAFTAYATDHRGAVLPGYYDIEPLPVFDEAGNDLGTLPAPVAARYPWRLAPYLDYDLRGLYLDKRVLTAFEDEAQRPYLVSLFPSLGMNTTFVGGDTSDGLAYDPLAEQVFGRFYITRLSQPKHPAELIVFASARSQVAGVLPTSDVIEGYFRVRPPYLVQRLWSDGKYDRNSNPDAFGFISLRDRKAAVTAFFDGHTGQLDDAQLQNPQYWADEANGPDWRLQPQ